MDENAITEEILLQAIRKRLLEEIQGRRERRNVIQNIIGGGGGMRGRVGQPPTQQQAIDPGMFDYYVDILKEDILGPEGKPIGWRKNVHRFREPKEPYPKKKI